MEKTIKWLVEIDEISMEVNTQFKILPIKKLFKKPNPDSWSIAENLEHLITINRTYFPIFEKLKDGSFKIAFIGKFSFFPNLIGEMIYKSVSDQGKKKQKTFPLWEPKLSSGDESIFERFYNQQDELKIWIKEMEPFVQKNTVIHSPASKSIVYSLERAFDIIVAHEWRHINQAKKVLADINHNNK